MSFDHLLVLTRGGTVLFAGAALPGEAARISAVVITAYALAGWRDTVRVSLRRGSSVFRLQALCSARLVCCCPASRVADGVLRHYAHKLEEQFPDDLRSIATREAELRHGDRFNFDEVTGDDTISAQLSALLPAAFEERLRDAAREISSAASATTSDDHPTLPAMLNCHVTLLSRSPATLSSPCDVPSRAVLLENV
jgi:hypothetical protein